MTVWRTLLGEAPETLFIKTQFKQSNMSSKKVSYAKWFEAETLLKKKTFLRKKLLFVKYKIIKM